MGDIADMMLDGTLCSQCGVYVGEDIGIPRCCDACAIEWKEHYLSDFPRKCDHCDKQLKNFQSMLDHNKAKHS